LRQATAALNDLRSLGIKKIDKFIITGGEPTLWPFLSELIGSIRKLFSKAKIRIDTNGVNFFINPGLFDKLGADIYNISIDSFHNKASVAKNFLDRDIFLNKNCSSPLVDFFIKNQVRFGFGLSARWTSNRRDDQIFSNFFKEYSKKINIERKLVTATGRGRSLPATSTGSGYLIGERPENFTCLMGDSLLLALDGCWYGCYHPASLTKLDKAGGSHVVDKFKKLVKSPLYGDLPRLGLLNVLNNIAKNKPEHRLAIKKILARKYWYRCQPCEDLCKEKVFKL